MKKTLIIAAAILAVGLYPVGAIKAQTSGVQDGIEAVEVVKASATVEKIDLGTRKATLKFDDGKQKTLKVDKSVQNLDKVKAGDHLNLTYTEDVVILVGKTKETAGAAAAGLVAIAPKGAKPGTVMVETTSLTAKVLSVDLEKHRVRLEEPDGKDKTIKLGKKATNLDQLKPGSTIDMVVTEELVVDVTP